MALDTSGKWWVGSGERDIDLYLASYTEDAHPVGEVVHATCSCGSRVFHVEADGDEGCVRRTCATCAVGHLVCDSADYLDDAEVQPVSCPCGEQRFELAVGFSRREDGSIGSLTVGIRCVACGILGSPAGWQIDYAPAEHLPTLV